MASINKTKFTVLELNDKNYQTWALDCEFHLQAMQLTSTIARAAAGVRAPPPHDHIHPDLKMEYLEVKVGEAPGMLWQVEGSASPTGQA